LSVVNAVVVPGALQVRGGLPKDIIRRIVRRHLNELTFCYETELVKKPALAGRVDIQLSISGQGAVTASIVARSTTYDASLDGCIARALRLLEFPKPKYGVVAVTYPFVLKVGNAEMWADAPVQHGTLDKELIRKTYVRNVRSLMPCYERERPTRADLGATIMVRFTIAETGAVVSSEVVASRVGNPRLEACVAQKFLAWMFPKPQGGPVVVTFPVGFRFAGPE
jgi:TonB family protein